jgi:hypothetical protein
VGAGPREDPGVAPVPASRIGEYCQAHPSQRGWRDHAAVFLQFLAEKPA